MSDVKFENKSWFPIIAAARFGQAPNAHNLARELRWLAEHWDPTTHLGNTSRFFHLRSSFLPWPLQACLSEANSKAELSEMASLAEKGALGDVKDWEQAEKRWKVNGVGDEDFRVMTDERWPFRAEIANHGFPFLASVSSPVSLQRSRVPQWLGLFNQAPGKKFQGWLASVMLDSFSGPFPSLGQSSLTPKEIRQILSLAADRNTPQWIDLSALMEALAANRLSAEWLDLLGWLGHQNYRFHFSREPFFSEQLFHQFCSDPEQWIGLLPIIATNVLGMIHNQISKEVLENIRRSKPFFAEDAIFLILTNRDLPKNELPGLANNLWGIENRKYSLSKILRTTAAVSIQRAAAFALELCTAGHLSSDSHADYINEAHQSLVEYLTKRSSALDQHGVWDDLHLPARV